ncbi:MAG: tetratricopeptide repeat protein [Chitinophagales bacterium]|nr:tetratricopeptide repeat protein [Chitinophagales bacterium]MDW8419524.1 tetratricopeptide repeat protein [Chitinophagales bacterium]
MSRQQWLLVIGCVVFGLSVYLFAPVKKKSSGAGTTPQTASAVEGDSLRIEEYIAEINSKITNDTLRNHIADWTRAGNYKSLVAAYITLDKPLAVLYYSVRLAEEKKSADEFDKAAAYAALLAQTAPDARALRWLNNMRIYCAEKAYALQTTDKMRLQLATAYIEASANPMQGVTILRDMVARDSTNVDAQLALARYGIMSGQYDKAIARLEKVLSLAPRNQDALLLLAQAYESAGEPRRALETLKIFRSTVSDPALQRQVDDYIRELTNKNNL